jgi:AcrR family transcriptional regulator
MVATLPAKKPRARSSRAVETVGRALDVVTLMLEEGGDASVRLAEVSKLSGVSVGSLYHHFKSRTGLIAAARERQFSRDLSYPGQLGANAYLAAETPADFIRVVDEMLMTSETPEAVAGRQHRFEMIGAASARPEELSGVIGLERDFLDAGEQIAIALQDRGWLREGIEPRAFALFLHSLSMVRVVRDLDDVVSMEAWRMVARESLAGMLTAVSS